MDGAESEAALSEVARVLLPGGFVQFSVSHPVSVTPSALAALSHHSWPCNVRELRNAVERAAVLGGTGPLEPRDFAMAGGTANGTGTSVALDLKSQVEAVERQAILRALEASGGNRRQAASLLGISLRTLFYKMRRLPVRTAA